MTPDRHGSAVIKYPNDLEIVITRSSTLRWHWSSTS